MKIRDSLSVETTKQLKRIAPGSNKWLLRFRITMITFVGQTLFLNEKLQENGLRSKRIHRTNSTQVKNGTMSSVSRNRLITRKVRIDSRLM
ncbi:hypothetical protein [Bacillus altitudinis]|uniref:hypothetical protein n=1 Tax=Bacillus altitudinis TaxID=293387 RepID=UPI002E228427|nr:hypothetical protein [Bacillus altitudinis]